MAKPNLPKIEADAMFYAAMSCLPDLKMAYRYFHAQGKTEEDFDRLAAETLQKAVKHAVDLTAREVQDPVWPYALDDAPGVQACRWPQCKSECDGNLCAAARGVMAADATQQALTRAAQLCDWIAENPHQRGSINGLAAQVQHEIAALRNNLWKSAL